MSAIQMKSRSGPTVSSMLPMFVLARVRLHRVEEKENGHKGVSVGKTWPSV